jgi:hypothetical protein
MDPDTIPNILRKDRSLWAPIYDKRTNEVPFLARQKELFRRVGRKGLEARVGIEPEGL